MRTPGTGDEELEMRKSKNNSCEIALIGYSQAGKTTLAVGLYATSTKEFTVTGIGEETEGYLRERKAALESGQWLDATTEQQMPNIRLSINRTGKMPVEIDFKEYMGERACNSDSYKRDVIGNPRGAMILLNPSMQILRDAKRRNDMIYQIKNIIGYLSEPDKRCENIAFVITASDLLTSSLSDYKDEFESYKNEITHCLNTNQKFRKAWKEFAVTVTGQLDDPRRPRIAREEGNTSRTPFEWLIEKIESAERVRSLKKTSRRIVVCLGAAIAIAACGFSSWYWGVDRESERRVKKVLLAHERDLEKAIKEGKATEINKLCSELEKGRASLPSKRIVFNANKLRHKKALDELANLIDTGRVAWYPLEIARFESEMTGVDRHEGLKIDEYKNRVERADAFGKKVDRFSVGSETLTGQDSGVKEQWKEASQRIAEALEVACCAGCKRRILHEEEEVGKLLLVKDKVIEGASHSETWKAFFKDYRGVKFTSKARAQLEDLLRLGASTRSNLFVRVDQHNSSVLEQHFEAHKIDAATTATEAKCSEWRREIETWVPFSPEGKQLQKKLLESFDCKKPEWRCAYESKCFADGSQALMAKLEKSLQNLDDGDSLHAELVECKKYEMYAGSDDALKLVDYKTRCETWEKIKQGRLKLLNRLQESQLGRIKPKGAEMPAISKDDSEFLYAVLMTDDVLSKEEYASWMDGLSKKIDEIREGWKKWQNDECEGFIKSLDGAKDAYGTLKKFESFYSQFPHAPNLTNVVETVNGVVVVSLQEVVRETAEYRDTPYNALNDDQALKIRRDRMNKTLNNLREVCRATSRAGGRCQLLKKTLSYRFANACLSKGNIDGGIAEAFKQKYHISRIDAQLDYAPQPDAWTREDGFPVNFKCVAFNVSMMGFDDAKVEKTLASVGQCEQLTEKDNRQWRTIWSGNATLEGSPWRDAVLSVSLTDMNKVSDDKSSGWWLSFQRGESLKFENNQPYWEMDYELNFKRMTGDPNPKIHFRIYVTPSGYDFFDIVNNH